MTTIITPAYYTGGSLFVTTSGSSSTALGSLNESQTIVSVFGGTAPDDTTPFAPYENVSPAAGVSPPSDKGYDTVASRLSNNPSGANGKGRRDTALSRCNAKLSDGTFFIDFFCTEVTINIGLAGSVGQGRQVRDFYPHNMVMPSYNISGICIDQDHYGTLCEFVHQAQQKGVYDGTQTQFQLNAGLSLYDIRKIIGDITPGYNPSSTIQNQTRGYHKPILALGFVSAMPRSHQRFVYAPTFTFSFVVSSQSKGIYEEDPGVATEQASWASILSTIVNDPTINPDIDTSSGATLSAAQTQQITSDSLLG